jgi:hypothetical protein
MDEEQKQDETAGTDANEQLEALIALVEARVVENLTRAIERMAAEREAKAAHE